MEYPPTVLSSEIPFAYVKGDQGGVGTATVRILDFSKYEKLIPDDKKHVGIAVMEEFVNGTGELWQTSAWIAAFVATSTLNRNLLNYEMLVKVPGFVDGPSAGMLTTVTLMALLNGDPILPGRCISGAINLDGSIGPVGGLLQKLDGCKKYGITHFGIPFGSQSEKGTNVIQAARNRYQIDAKALTTVFDAYEFMTGKQLKEQNDELIDETELELNQSTKERVHGIVLDSISRLKEQVAACATRMRKAPMEKDFAEFNKKDMGMKEVQDACKERFAEGRSEVDRLIDEGEKAEGGGNYVLAYNRTVMAQRWVQILNGCLLCEDYRVLRPGHTEEQLLGILSELLAKLHSRNSALTDRMKGLSRKVETALSRRFLSGQIDAILCSFYFAQTQAAFESGRRFHRGYELDLAKWIRLFKASSSEEPPNLGDLLGAFEEANQAYAVARVNADTVTDWIGCIVDGGMVCDPPSLQGTIEQLARVYAAGSSAALGAYDGVVNARAAERADKLYAANGTPPSDIEKILAQVELKNRNEGQNPMIKVYRQASQRAAFADTETLDLAPHFDSVLRCASGATALLGGTKLIAQHYTIGFEIDAKGNLTLDSLGVLGSILENARKEVRRKAARLKKAISIVPEGVRLDYQLAKDLQYGKDDADKLLALDHYWRAGQICSIAELCAKAAIRNK